MYNMTTVADLIKQLQELPQDAIVRVMHEVSCSHSTYGAFSPCTDISFFDYSTEEAKIKYPKMKGAKIVTLMSD
jgi:hypothetical protein